MKLVLFNENEIIDVIENILNLTIKGDEIIYDGNLIGGISCKYVVLDDNVDISNGITEEIKALDKSEQFKNTLEQRIVDLELAIALLLGQ